MIPLSFLVSIVLKILTFSYSVRRPSRRNSVIGNSKKRFNLKDTVKNSIKTMEIASLLNTDYSN